MTAPTQVSEEEILRVAEKLREELVEKYSESEEVDLRDLQRAQRDLRFVVKYARHQKGDYNNAFNNLIESFKWRKSFGVNDIRFEDIDDNFWRMGLAYDHGQDKKGNHIVILNIRFHKRDSRRSKDLQRWIAFCFETHTRVFSNEQMCMIFDMTGCGLSQMDMDLMRFIVNSFKIYFPNLLGQLLVVNMPWILQAAWKIVQSWLSEGAVSKIKFVNNTTISEYISSDQLLLSFGGTDEWQYDYEVEKTRMLDYVQKVWREEEEEEEEEDEEEEGVEFRSIMLNEVQSGDMASDLLEDSLGGHIEGEGGRGGGGEEATLTSEEGRKVRFSSNLPPTRQSRFGPEERSEEEEEAMRVHGHGNQQLLRGSAASHGFRHRQVHKLMSLQSDSRVQRLDNSVDYSPRGQRSSIGNRRHSELLTSDARPLTLGDTLLSPPEDLKFVGTRSEDLLCALTLTNTSNNIVAFKIKTTAPRRYKVRPNLALIDANSTAKVQILLVSGSTDDIISQDKFLVQVHSLPPSSSPPSPTNLLSYWRALPTSEIREQRMRCSWVESVDPPSPPSLTSPSHTSTPSQASLTEKRGVTGEKKGGGGRGGGGSVVSSEVQPQEELRNIRVKLELLVTVNQELTETVKLWKRWNMVMCLLVLLLVTAIFLF